jgi:hypothetical protein
MNRNAQKRYKRVHTPLLIQEIANLHDAICEFEDHLEGEIDEDLLFDNIPTSQIAALTRDLKAFKEKLKIVSVTVNNQ